MDYNGFNEGFDILFNNITSNQAPGLNIHEKSLFCTKAEYEIVRNHFTANSKGNNIGQGFDDSAIRQADFSSLMMTATGTSYSDTNAVKSHQHGKLFKFPENVFIVINETFRIDSKDLQVIPLRYDEYTRLMSKPFKRPVAGQAWRIIGNGNASDKIVELVAAPEYDSVNTGTYIVRFIRKPKPIILGDLDGLDIDGYTFGTGDNQIQGCELDSAIHDQILQRAVELAKVAWTATGQDNTQVMLQAGQRSE